MSIRWDNRTNTELRRVVNNFNSKIRRLEKKERNLHLPDKISIKQIKKEYNNRQDLNNYMKYLQRYSRRGAENTFKNLANVEMSIWERRELGIKSRVVTKALKKEILEFEEREATIGGVGIGFSYAQMGSMEGRRLMAILKGISDLDKMDKTKLKKAANTINKRYSKEELEKKNNQFKENYLQALKANFGVHGKALRLYNVLKQIPANTFYNLIKFDDVAVDIPFMYEQAQVEAVLESIIQAWIEVTGYKK